MIVPDVNLLLYASDEESPFFEDAKLWWEASLSGGEEVGLTHPVLFAFLRISTNGRVFREPLTVEEAGDRIKSWLARSITRVLLPGSSHEDKVFALLQAAGSAGGNLVTDAQIAELALAAGGVVHTADRDFLRFPKLKTRFPLDKT